MDDRTVSKTLQRQLSRKSHLSSQQVEPLKSQNEVYSECITNIISTNKEYGKHMYSHSLSKLKVKSILLSWNSAGV